MKLREWGEKERADQLMMCSALRKTMRELSDIRLRWAYWHGIIELEPVTGKIKPGRNDRCSCGSGKKYKKCCG